MSHGKHINQREKARIRTLYNQGLKAPSIARILDRNRSAIHKTIVKMKADGDLEKGQLDALDASRRGKDGE